jgi:hypothetical protein
MAPRFLETTKTIRLQSVSSDPLTTRAGTLRKTDDLEPGAVFVAWQVERAEPKRRVRSDSNAHTSDLSMLPFVWLG